MGHQNPTGAVFQPSMAVHLPSDLVCFLFRVCLMPSQSDKANRRICPIRLS